MKKRGLSILLILSLLLALMAPLQVLAAEEWTELPGGGQYNPLYYDGSETPEAPEVPAERATVRAANSYTYVSVNEAAAQLRDAMVARQETVELHVYIPQTDYWYDSANDNWFTGYFMPLVYSQELAVGLTDGDYLRWSWRTVSQNGSTNGSQYNFTVSLSYYTTAQQEQAFLEALDQVMENLDLEGASALERYTAIYDYVTEHVDYDYDGLSAWEEQCQTQEWNRIDRSYFEIYTAYAALMKGSAVCQGYSALYYAMCRWADLPVRIVSSPAHSFNIVNLKDIWYYVDSTYDSDTSTGREWFLLGSKNFEQDYLHSPEATFRADEFQKAYPISQYDYDPDQPFNDLEPGSWYYASVKNIADQGLMNGMGNSRFAPDGTVNRAMVATVLYRMAGEPSVSGSSSFPDVPAGAYYEKAVAWAQANRIVVGFEDNTFRPDQPVTREQFATMLYRYAKSQGLDLPQGSLSSFPDRAAVSSYARDAIAWAVGVGIINGIDEGGVAMLRPQNGALRAQLATMLDRYLDWAA